MIESFLISLIANFVTIGGQTAIKRIIKNEDLAIEIKNSFDHALKKWTVNKNIRGKEEKYIQQKLNLLIECIKEPSKISTLDDSVMRLVTYFKLELQKSQIAWNFIMDTHFQNEINKLNNIEDTVVSIQGLLEKR